MSKRVKPGQTHHGSAPANLRVDAPDYLLPILLVAAALLAAGAWFGQRLSDWTAPLTPHQIGLKLLNDGRALEATQLLNTNAWRAVAMYRAGRYQNAARLFGEGSDADSAYNQGNAYVRLRRYDEALEAYRRALSRDPGHTDAQTNLALLRQLDKPERDSSDGGQQSQQGKPQASADDQGSDSKQANERPKGVQQRTRSAPPQRSRPQPPRAQKDPAQSPNTQTASTSAGNRNKPQQKPGQASPSQTRAPELAKLERPLDDNVGSAPPSAPKTDKAPERALAEDIALRKLVDDPALVLRARIQAATQLRQRQ